LTSSVAITSCTYDARSTVANPASEESSAAIQDLIALIAAICAKFRYYSRVIGRTARVCILSYSTTTTSSTEAKHLYHHHHHLVRVYSFSLYGLGLKYKKVSSCWQSAHPKYAYTPRINQSSTADS